MDRGLRKVSRVGAVVLRNIGRLGRSSHVLGSIDGVEYTCSSWPGRTTQRFQVEAVVMAPSIPPDLRSRSGPFIWSGQ
eukprot:1334207-Amorphochlora_amoeboformis.AAC.2